jgi:sigma-E factor negative regulatory protein RseC
LVEVHCTDAGSFMTGQSVTVVCAETLGFKAIVFAFGLPLLLLLAALITGMSATGSEKVAAIASVSVLVPYYLILFLLRDRFKKDFQFRIIQNN